MKLNRLRMRLGNFSFIIHNSTFLIILLFYSITALGQDNKQRILKYFKTIDYYPDSLIRCAYNTKKGLKTGYAIEFDSLGNAFAIGKYKKGKKEGYWFYPTIRWEYKNGVQGLGAIAPEGNELLYFKDIYNKVLHLPS